MTATEVIPSVVIVKNNGQEPLSLAGMITVQPAKDGTTTVKLGKLDADKRGIAFAALRNCAKAKKLSIVSVDDDTEDVDVGVSKTTEGQIKKDSGIRDAKKAPPASTGVGGQVGEVLKEKGKPSKRLDPAPEVKSDAPQNDTEDTNPPSEELNAGGDTGGTGEVVETPAVPTADTPTPPANPAEGGAPESGEAPTPPAAETTAAPVAPPAPAPAAPVETTAAAPAAPAAPAAEATEAPTPPPAAPAAPEVPAAPAAPESNEADAGNVPTTDTPTAPSAGDL